MDQELKYVVWGYQEVDPISLLYKFLLEKEATYTWEALETAEKSGASTYGIFNNGWVVELICTENDLEKYGKPNRNCAGWMLMES